MSNYDYEIKDYAVEWKIGEKSYKQDGFSTEESAGKFARKKLKTADSVSLIKESRAIDCMEFEITEETDIDNVIKQIESLFNSLGNDNRSFTVDYDNKTGGIYCNYAPYPNDNGYAVSEDLLFVDDTSQDNLKRLEEWLKEKKIYSREGCEWDYLWGWKNNYRTGGRITPTAYFITLLLYIDL